jgi:hypothetical protein
MRALLRIAAITTAAGLLLAPAATMASASTAAPHPAATHAARVHLTSGETSLTTVSGLAAELLGDNIVPFATTPGTETLVGSGSDPQLKFSFPVTGGRVNPARLTGTMFSVGLSHVKVRRIGVHLTTAGAEALDNALGTGLFTEGMKIAEARTLVRF